MRRAVKWKPTCSLDLFQKTTTTLLKAQTFTTSVGLSQQKHCGLSPQNILDEFDAKIGSARTIIMVYFVTVPFQFRFCRGTCEKFS